MTDATSAPTAAAPGPAVAIHQLQASMAIAMAMAGTAIPASMARKALRVIIPLLILNPAGRAQRPGRMQAGRMRLVQARIYLETSRLAPA